MEAKIGAALTRLRAEAGLSQRELAGRLRLNGVAVTNQAVSKWEHGLTQPNATQFLALCRVLRVRDVLGAFTGAPSAGWADALNTEGRKKAEEYVRLLEASGLYADRPQRSGELVRSLPLYRISVSAGTGQFLDSSEYEMVDVGGEVPLSANFGVHISGDSMEPRFLDGQTVWVHQQQTLEPGEIGIFLYDGSSYCKRFARRGGEVWLESVNPAYAPIPVKSRGELRVFGRVVG